MHLPDLHLAVLQLAQAVEATTAPNAASTTIPIGSGSASTPSGPFDRPLEPWLVTWILAFGGIISAGAVRFADGDAQRRRRR